MMDHKDCAPIGNNELLQTRRCCLRSWSWPRSTSSCSVLAACLTRALIAKSNSVAFLLSKPFRKNDTKSATLILPDPSPSRYANSRSTPWSDRSVAGIFPCVRTACLNSPGSSSPLREMPTCVHSRINVCTQTYNCCPGLRETSPNRRSPDCPPTSARVAASAPRAPPIVPARSCRAAEGYANHRARESPAKSQGRFLVLLSFCSVESLQNRPASTLLPARSP